MCIRDRYKQECQAFVPRYMKLLSYGGSVEPYRALQEAGFDVATPAFWQLAYDALARRLDELESL